MKVFRSAGWEDLKNNSRNNLFNYIYQILGWIIAANFFVILKGWGIEDQTGFLVYMQSDNLVAVHLEASLMGFFMGLILAYIDSKRSRIFTKKAFGLVILIKAFSYLATNIIIVTVVAFIFLIILGASLGEALTRIYSFFLSTYFATIVIYGAIVSFFISFIKQIDSKFGPGNLHKMLVGKYHKPRIEDRIFLFMDLKNSTGFAERLGHIEFSQLLQDCFYDITSVLIKYRAEVYQYIGDEVVITWESKIGLKNLNCVNLFFGYLDIMNKRSEYYQKKYGLKPEFKAGMNCGRVTVAEIGTIRREVHYHGDILNTASRIQMQCNEYDKSFLVSGQLYNRLGGSTQYNFELINTVLLKGKKSPTDLYSIELKSNK